jgi:hypothetical protein
MERQSRLQNNDDDKWQAQAFVSAPEAAGAGESGRMSIGSGPLEAADAAAPGTGETVATGDAETGRAVAGADDADAPPGSATYATVPLAAAVAAPAAAGVGPFPSANSFSLHHFSLSSKYVFG